MERETVLHPIKVVARKTGLSPHLIRIWERRYGAVSPERTESQRRMYSEDQIERLKLLRLLTEAGHSIGGIAKLSVNELRAQLGDNETTSAVDTRQRMRSQRRASGQLYVECCIDAIAELDQAKLEKALKDGSVALGQQGVLIHVVAPLAAEVGNLWQDGTIGVAHEHFASAILRTFLGTLSRPFAFNESAPHIITATPTGQLHEMGAMIITASSVALGWQATYLGASLAPVEIASALKQRPASAIGLSIVYPPDDPGVADEMRRLRQLVPSDVSILAGGRAAGSYHAAAAETGIILCGDLEDFMQKLEATRSHQAGEKNRPPAPKEIQVNFTGPEQKQLNR